MPYTQKKELGIQPVLRKTVRFLISPRTKKFARDVCYHGITFTIANTISLLLLALINLWNNRDLFLTLAKGNAITTVLFIFFYWLLRPKKKKQARRSRETF